MDGEIDRLLSHGKRRIVEPGEMPLLDGGPAPANVTARGAAVVLELAYDELTAELELDPGFAGRFYRALAVMVGERYRAERFGDPGKPTDGPIAHGINTYLAEDRMH